MKPNPGSKEAIEQGCKCPVMDNFHGKGAYIDDDGKPAFWISSECKLHGVIPKTLLDAVGGDRDIAE